MSNCSYFGREKKAGTRSLFRESEGNKQREALDKVVDAGGKVKKYQDIWRKKVGAYIVRASLSQLPPAGTPKKPRKGVGVSPLLGDAGGARLLPVLCGGRKNRLKGGRTWYTSP